MNYARSFYSLTLACALTAAIASCNKTKNTETTSGEQEYQTSDIEANTATAENPENTKVMVQGDVKFQDTMFQFGKVEEGVEVEHIFKFKNTGKGIVYISQVTPGCTCTVTDYTKDAIAPGKEGQIKATFDTSGKGGPGGVMNEKSIDVSFENSKTANFTLKFQAYVFTKG